jgi:hypothetical protein
VSALTNRYTKSARRSAAYHNHTPSHITTLLGAQTNDQERCALAERIIIELINKNNERKDLLENNEKLLKEQKDLLENNENLLKEQKDVLENNEKPLKEQKDLLEAKDNYSAMTSGNSRHLCQKGDKIIPTKCKRKARQKTKWR